MNPVAPARDRLLEAAHELFYAHGVTATGIDAITARAGVARKSLYNNFASKDALVAAYLEDRHEQWLARFAARKEQAESAAERALAVFDAYVDHAEAEHLEGFRGCGLLNAAAELPAGALGREAVRHHKEQVENLLCEALAEIMREEEARQLAEHLSFVLEGAVSRAGLEGTADRLRRAREIAEGLVAAR